MAENIQEPWAKPADIGLEALERVQRGLTVSSIMTPRRDFKTCRPEDIAREVNSRNVQKYSYLPVLDESGAILGLYKAEKWFEEEAPDQPIGVDFEPLQDAPVINADSTIIEFLQTADEKPTRLVVSGPCVVGLVGLSDLQQLPVQAALFTLIVSLETAMARRIEVEWPDGTGGWCILLSKKRRKEVRQRIRESKSGDGFVSKILCTQLVDKCTIVRKRHLIAGSQTQLERDFSDIRKLRDQLAHANYLLATPREALKVCSVAKKILDFRQELEQPASAN